MTGAGPVRAGRVRAASRTASVCGTLSGMLRPAVVLVALAATLVAGAGQAFVPPSLTKALREDPMVTVAPPSGKIPAPSTVAAAPADAEVSPSGLRSKVLRGGVGPRPTAADTVVVHYTGWTTDGKMFDSSVVRKAPAAFKVGSVIKGFGEGMLLMRVGEQRRLWIPGYLAYGDAPHPGRPTGTLVFDVEIVRIDP